MSKLTVEDKYNWLLSKLNVVDVDYWENDALLKMKTMYFQFPVDVDPKNINKDEVVVLAIKYN